MEAGKPSALHDLARLGEDGGGGGEAGGDGLQGEEVHGDGGEQGRQGHLPRRHRQGGGGDPKTDLQHNFI